MFSFVKNHILASHIEIIVKYNNVFPERWNMQRLADISLHFNNTK